MTGGTVTKQESKCEEEEEGVFVCLGFVFRIRVFMIETDTHRKRD